MWKWVLGAVVIAAALGVAGVLIFAPGMVERDRNRVIPA